VTLRVAGREPVLGGRLTDQGFAGRSRPIVQINQTQMPVSTRWRQFRAPDSPALTYHCNAYFASYRSQPRAIYAIRRCCSRIWASHVYRYPRTTVLSTSGALCPHGLLQSHHLFRRVGRGQRDARQKADGNSSRLTRHRAVSQSKGRRVSMARAVIDGRSAPLVLEPTKEHRRVLWRNFG
jgi:hypothetical protein